MLAYRSLFSMGTRIEMVFPDIEEDFADHLVLQIREQLLIDEGNLSLYDPASVFSRLNREAFQSPAELEPELFNLVTDLIRWSDLTNNYFDFTLGKIKLAARNPETEEISTMLACPVHERMVLDQVNQTVSFRFQEVSLDSGAFGKGYALDHLKKILFSNKIKSAFISFGESSVLTLGAHPAGDAWKVGIEDLIQPGHHAWVFTLNNGSVSTSGNRMENLVKNPHGHIFNPRTHSFNTSQAVVSVSGGSSLMAEVLSTALFIAPPEERTDILSRFPGFQAVGLSLTENGQKTHVQSI